MKINWTYVKRIAVLILVLLAIYFIAVDRGELPHNLIQGYGF